MSDFTLKSSKIRIASFDIGHCNFAQYVEDVEVDKMLELEKKYKSLPKGLQRKVKGPMSEEIEALLLETCLSGSRVTTGVYNFTSESAQGLDIQARKGLLCHLQSFIDTWQTCDIFVIEQQYFNMGVGKNKQSAGSANIDAIKVGEATFMWILERYPDKEIMYFGSQNKTQILGAPWKMSKPERKKWSAKKAEEMYTLRKDSDMIELFRIAEEVKRKRLSTDEKVQVFIQNYTLTEDKDVHALALKIVKERQKLDDISDAFTQLQAFKFKTMVGCF
jgi:hypothetical protein